MILYEDFLTAVINMCIGNFVAKKKSIFLLVLRMIRLN